MTDVIETNRGRVRIIQLNHENPNNPFNRALENALKSALKSADADSNVDAVVIYGGTARSFSAGGDFNEVKNLSSGPEIDEWIDRVTDLYTSVLRLEKPSVAAIDGFAIGIGFQLAMMCDWRLMSRSAELRMPELKYGIGCSMGAVILGEITSWNTMRDIIYRCDGISADQALQYNLINDITGQVDLLDAAVARASSLANYPTTAFRSTKRVVNQRLIAALIDSSNASKQVHRAAFTARDAQRHFQAILGEKYEHAE